MINKPAITFSKLKSRFWEQWLLLEISEKITNLVIQFVIFWLLWLCSIVRESVHCWQHDKFIIEFVREQSWRYILPIVNLLSAVEAYLRILHSTSKSRKCSQQSDCFLDPMKLISLLDTVTLRLVFAKNPSKHGQMKLITSIVSWSVVTNFKKI